MVIECSARPKFKKGMRKPFEEILEKYGLHMGLNSICARFALIAEGLEEMLFLQKLSSVFMSDKGSVIVYDENGKQIAKYTR